MTLWNQSRMWEQEIARWYLIKCDYPADPAYMSINFKIGTCMKMPN